MKKMVIGFMIFSTMIIEKAFKFKEEKRFRMSR